MADNIEINLVSGKSKKEVDELAKGILKVAKVADSLNKVNVLPKDLKEFRDQLDKSSAALKKFKAEARAAVQVKVYRGDLYKARQSIEATISRLEKLKEVGKSVTLNATADNKMLSAVNNLSAGVNRLNDSWTRVAETTKAEAKEVEKLSAKTKSATKEVSGIVEKRYKREKQLHDELQEAKNKSLAKETELLKRGNSGAYSTERTRLEAINAQLKAIKERNKLQDKYNLKLDEARAKLGETKTRGIPRQLPTFSLDKEGTRQLKDYTSESIDKLNQKLKEEEALRRKVAKRIREQKRSGERATRSLKKFNSEMWDGSKAAAAFRAGMLASGHGMGLFTSKTLIAATATYTLVKAIRQTVSVGSEYEKTMVRAQAISGSLGKNFDKVTPSAKLLDKSVRDVAKGTIFTANEVAKAASQFAMAGFNANQIAKMLGPTASLASIGLMDMEKAAGLAAATMKMFRSENISLKKVVDVMAKAVTESMLTMESLSNSLSYVGPIANEAGTKFTSVVAILEAMNDAGVKGSKSGTALRRGIINLLNPTKKQQDVLSKLRVETKYATGEMKDMLVIVKELKDKGITPAQLATLFGARAVSAWAATLQRSGEQTAENTKSLEEMKEGLDGSTGSAKKLRQALEKNLTDQFSILKSAINDVYLEIYDNLAPTLLDTVKSITRWVRALQEGEGAVNKLKDAVATAGKVIGVVFSIAAIGRVYKFLSALSRTGKASKGVKVGIRLLSSGFNKMRKSVNLAKVATYGLRTAMLAITAHPLIAALTALAGVYLYIANSADKAKKSAGKVSPVQSRFDSLKDSVTGDNRDAKLKKLKRLLAKSEALKIQESVIAEGVEDTTNSRFKFDKFGKRVKSDDQIKTELAEFVKEANYLREEIYATEKEIAKLTGNYKGSYFEDKDEELRKAKERREALKRKHAEAAKIMKDYKKTYDPVKEAVKLFKLESDEVKQGNELLLNRNKTLMGLGKISKYKEASEREALLTKNIVASNEAYDRRMVVLKKIADDAERRSKNSSGEQIIIQAKINAEAKRTMDELTVAHQKKVRVDQQELEALQAKLPYLEKLVEVEGKLGNYYEARATRYDANQYNAIIGGLNKEFSSPIESIQSATDSKAREATVAYNSKDLDLQAQMQQALIDSDLERWNQYYDQRKQLELDSQEALFQIELDGWAKKQAARDEVLGMGSKVLKDMINFDKDNVLGSTANILKGMSSLMGKFDDGSKKAFEDRKKMAIATATISTIASVMDTYAAFGKGVLGAAAATAMAGIGAKNIQMIAAQKYNGGGSSSVSSGASASVPTVTPPSVPVQSDAFFNQTQTTQQQRDTSQREAVNVNFNIQAMDASSFDTLLARRKGTIVGMIQQAYLDNGRRGGPA